MYRNLERIVIGKRMQPGGILGLSVIMAALLGMIAFFMIQNGSTWENDRNQFLLLGGWFMLYILLLPLPYIRARRIARRRFEKFTPMQLQRMDLDCMTLEPIGNVFVTQYALVSAGILIPMEEIIWIFIQKHTERMVATIQTLVVVTEDQKHHQITFRIKAGPFRQESQKDVEELILQLGKYSPGIYFGDSKELRELYRNDFARMVANVRNKRR